jgi:hypothetical protein
MKKKKCIKCLKRKVTKAFSSDASREDGLYVYCRECVSGLTAERFADPEYRKKHNADNKRRYDDSVDWVKKLKDKPCMDCGRKFPACAMDFDHVRGTKRFNVTTSLRKRSSILREAKKCDLVCANCHRIRTNNRRKK